MQIIDNTALKMRVPPRIVERILKRLPRSEQTLDKRLLVAWDQNEAEFLAHVLDEELPHAVTPPIPSPMLRDYNWPGILRPFDHQKTTASFLSIRHRAFCFNEQGTAKTASAIWAADYLMNLGLVRRVLVICPLSIMETAWRADVMQTAMHRSVGVAHGDRAKRLKIINGSFEFVIINYDGVPVVESELSNQSFDLIIVDECNAYKTSSTRRWKTLAKLLRPSTRLWMLTGTPASQSPIDAFGLARLVSPERVPKFKTTWRDQVMTQITRFTWVPKENSRTKVFAALQPAIRYTKKECLDLPDLIYETRSIPLSLQAANYYTKLKKQLQIKAAGEEISAVNAAAAMSKLLQLSGGAVYTDEGNIVEFDIGPRLQVLGEVLDESSNKVIVFVPFLHTIDVITKYLQSRNLSCDVIRGDVSAHNRAQIINRFQRELDPRVLVIQPASASHGVTLTAADTIVFWSPVISVETYLQCIGRINRVGQRNKMLVVHLQGSEVERRVYSMLQGKVDNHIKLVDLYRQELGI